MFRLHFDKHALGPVARDERQVLEQAVVVHLVQFARAPGREHANRLEPEGHGGQLHVTAAHSNCYGNRHRANLEDRRALQDSLVLRLSAREQRRRHPTEGLDIHRGDGRPHLDMLWARDDRHLAPADLAVAECVRASPSASIPSDGYGWHGA